MLIKLNADQFRAVEHEEGPCALVAIPGSGKTQCIIYRMKRLMEKGCIEHPSEINAITFTNKAANEMKERATALLGGTPRISTLDSFARGILFEHPQQCMRQPGISTAENGKTLFIDFLKHTGRSIGKSEVNSIFSVFKSLRLKGVFPLGPDYTGFVEKFYLNNIDPETATFISGLLQDFERYKQDLNIVEIEDFVYLALIGIKANEWLAKKVAASWKYLFIDEFQDTSEIQYELIKEICLFNPNVFVVGDDDQGIYSFRGAQANAITEFIEDFDSLCGVRQIYLTHNYRTSVEILIAAEKLINHNDNRIKKRFVATVTNGDALKFNNCSHMIDFEQTLVANVKKDINDGVPLSEISILYRNNNLGYSIKDALNRAGIESKRIGNVDSASSKEIELIKALIGLYGNPRSYMSFMILGKYLHNVNEKNIATTISISQNTNTDILDVCRGSKIKKMRDAADEVSFLFNEMSRIESKFIVSYLCKENFKFKTWLQKIAQSRTSSTVPFNTVVYQQDILLDMFSKLAYESVTKLNMTNTPQQSKFDPVLDVRIDESHYGLGKDSAEDEAVNIGTIHSSKGLEFQSVHIPFVAETILPSYSAKRSLSAANEEEERRVFYVGVTRSQQKCQIYHSPNIRTEDYPIQGLTFSRFIEECGIDVYNNMLAVN